MSGNLGGLSERLCYLLSECWTGSRALLPECRALTTQSALLPECRVLPAQSDGCRNAGRVCMLGCRDAGRCRISQLCCRDAGRCRLCQTVERCKIFESKVLPYCFEKIFDRGRSALILIPQIRNLGSCFLIDIAFFLTIMLKVVILTEYHASNRTERLH